MPNTMAFYTTFFPATQKCYPKDEWKNVIKNIVNAFNGQNQLGGVYVKILVQEKLKPQLFEYCKKNTYQILSYYKHILPEYAAEVGDILVRMIQERASRADTRKSYSEVCDLIRHYQNACGRAKALAVRDELKAKFPKRPAFLDELGKV
jgi:hypothetical protein